MSRQSGDPAEGDRDPDDFDGQPARLAHRVEEVSIHRRDAKVRGVGGPAEIAAVWPEMFLEIDQNEKNIA
jgi:hypothetical protein